MASQTRLLVYSILYNESQFLPAMLESLLNQTDQDFSLLLSDNFSTDGTADIIESHRDLFPSLSVIKPPNFLSGIEHARFAQSHVLENCLTYTHIVFLGGHDIFSPDTIKCLKARAEESPASAIIYTDTFRLSQSGAIIERYPVSLDTAGVPRHLVPVVVLIGMVFNSMSSGIMRFDVFAANKLKYACCAADHFLTCEAGLFGPITYSPGGGVFLRDAPTFTPGWRYYVEKHISEANRAKGSAFDFSLQISWLVNILERSAGVSAAVAVDDPVLANYFLSAIQLYLIRYGQMAQGFVDGTPLLASDLYIAVQANDLARVLKNVNETEAMLEAG
jgi:glycosyltransferase involved in cell wall biosynthesis